MEVLRKLSYIFSKKQKIKFLFLLVILFGASLFEALGVSLIFPFVSALTDPNLFQKYRKLDFIYKLLNINSTKDLLFAITIAVIVVYIVKNLYLLFTYYCQYRFTYNNQIDMSGRLLGCYLRKPYTFHLQKNTSEIIRSVTKDVTDLFQLVLSCILSVSEILVIVMLCSVMLLTDVYITVVVVVLLVVCLFAFYFAFKKRLILYGNANLLYSGLMIKWVNQAIGGIKEIKVFNREQFFIDSYNKSGIEYIKTQKRYNFLNQTPRLLIETVCIVGMMILVLIMLSLDKNFDLLLPKLATFAMVAFRILPSVSRLNINNNQIIYFKPCVDLIYRDLHENEEVFSEKMDEKENTKKALGNFAKTQKKIVVNDLSFRYPNNEGYILKDVNFEIPIGKSVAFIGISGAGKTTTVDIILGLLKPEKGSVKADDLDIHENSEIWSQKVGYIPQTIYLTDDSIRNNVAFGIEENNIDDESVWDALEQAQIKEFVENLPQKLDTAIGERGVRISGGQRQRIGIARALYHNPEILVLDEATSSLDNETEQAVMDAIENLQGKITMIIVAHRLTTIRNCDIVYEVKDGIVWITKGN